MDMVEEANISYDKEGWRKATHLFALIMPIGYFILGKTIALSILIPAAFLIVLFDAARLGGWKLWSWVAWIWGPLIRPHESRKLTGASWIMIATVATVLMFSKPVAVCALAFIIIGDSAGALIGRKWGRHKFRNSKSVEGSTAFFLSCLIPVALVPGVPLWIGAIGAVVGTFTEAFSAKVDDNLSVPLVSGLTMHILIRFVG